MTELYQVAVVDPPWPVRKGGRRAVRPAQGRALDYATLDVPAIFALLDGVLLPQLSSPACMFLWVVDRVLPQAEVAMQERGWRLHARMVWDKGNGVAPAFTVRYCHEYLLWYYKPKLLPVARAQRGKWGTVLHEQAREHSRKPVLAYTMIDALYPGTRKLDVFSREDRTGWDAWGAECGYFNER